MNLLLILMSTWGLGTLVTLSYAIHCMLKDPEFRKDILDSQDPVRRNGVLLDIIAWPIPVAMIIADIAWESLEGVLRRLGIK